MRRIGIVALGMALVLAMGVGVEAATEFDTVVPAPQIVVTPDSFAVTLAEGDSTSGVLTIGNVGDVDLTFEINHGVVVSLTEAEKAVLAAHAALRSARREDDDSSVPVSEGGAPFSPLGQPAVDAGALLPVGELIIQFPDYSGNAHPMGIAFDGT
ncbi:MAG: hypothetical protein KAQ78_05975, partial [Candidatus Latescibacteria bacterium]|nr:hypothetical protein [Candidatus Latescibacterota bacterium]